MIIAQATWLALPVILGGLVHVAVIELDLLPALARLPLDGGVTVRGRRLLGDHKTVRGAVTMIGATTAFVDFGRIRPLVWGLVLGGGYIVGELPNSFVKRQLDVAPGERPAGPLAPVFWLCDELDSLAGVLVCMSAVWAPPAHVALVLAGVTLVAHPFIDLLKR